MTLHQSTGLEFDTVIIPGLDRTPANEGHALLLWQEHLSESGQRELLLSPLAATGQEQDALYGFIRQEAERRRRHEATRLLYVGCTRAIKRLHLLASLKANSKSGEVEKPSARTLLSCIWPQVEAQLLAPPTPPVTSRMPSDAESPQEQTHILRLPPTWQAPRPESTTLLAAYRGPEHDDEENRPDPDTRTARLASGRTATARPADPARNRPYAERRGITTGTDAHSALAAYMAATTPRKHNVISRLPGARI